MFLPAFDPDPDSVFKFVRIWFSNFSRSRSGFGSDPGTKKKEYRKGSKSDLPEEGEPLLQSCRHKKPILDS